MGIQDWAVSKEERKHRAPLELLVNDLVDQGIHTLMVVDVGWKCTGVCVNQNLIRRGI